MWYTYWVVGAGYGAAKDVGYGHRADVSKLRSLTRVDAERLKGWCRVVYADATLAMVIGTVVTIGFLIAGAIVLPKLFNEEAREVIRPHWIFGLGLLVAFLVFGYFCIFQIPNVL